MGAKAKRRKAAVAAVAADAPPPLQPVKPSKRAKPKHAHAPGAASDPVTGEAIDPKRYHFYRRMPTVDESRPEEARQPIPTAINSSRETAVGRDWTPEFARYIANALPRIIAEEQRMWLRWYDIAYVVERLRKRLGHEAVEVTLAVVRDCRETREVATAWQHSDGWVRAHLNRVCTLAETYFTHR